MTLRLPDDAWTRLSDRGRWVLENIASPHAEGVPLEEIAARLQAEQPQKGWSRRSVGRAMDELREELLALSGVPPIPPLTDEEYAALYDDIADRGVLEPILVDEHGQIIDGHHREKIAAELAIDCPRRELAGLTDEQKREVALALNMTRRHLTGAQRRAVVASELRRNPGRSDRRIARLCGVSHPTVAAVRAELEQTGDVEELSTRADTTGRRQPVTRQRPAAEANSTESPHSAPGLESVTVHASRAEIDRWHAAAASRRRIVVEADDDEYRAWTQAAEAEGLPVADWLRRVANDAALLEVVP